MCNNCDANIENNPTTERFNYIYIIIIAVATLFLIIMVYIIYRKYKTIKIEKLKEEYHHKKIWKCRLYHIELTILV